MYVWGGGYGPDGKTLFLDISTIDANTKRALPSDIWVSKKQGNDWSEPQRLGDGINSPGYDNFWFFSRDGRELYFVRDFSAFYRLPLSQALRTIK